MLDDELAEEWLKEDETAGELLAQAWRRKMDFVKRKKGVRISRRTQATAEENGVLGKGRPGNGTPVGARYENLFNHAYIPSCFMVTGLSALYRNARQGIEQDHSHGGIKNAEVTYDP